MIDSRKLICIDQSWFYNFLLAGEFKNVSLNVKYFGIFKNTPPASWVAHTTRVFFTCYTCSYYILIIISCLYCARIFIRRSSSQFYFMNTSMALQTIKKKIFLEIFLGFTNQLFVKGKKLPLLLEWCFNYFFLVKCRCHRWAGR